MLRIAKPVQWAPLVVILLVIGTTFFAGQPLIRQRPGLTQISTTHREQDTEDADDHIAAKARQSYQSNCEYLANQQTNHPQTPTRWPINVPTLPQGSMTQCTMGLIPRLMGI